MGPVTATVPAAIRYHPGVIRTRMIKNIWEETARLTNRTVEEAERLSLRMVPFGTLGEPEDVAFLILYLAELKHLKPRYIIQDNGLANLIPGRQ